MDLKGQFGAKVTRGCGWHGDGGLRWKGKWENGQEENDLSRGAHAL